MNPGRALLVALLQAYRYFLSPAKNALLGQSGSCRFKPTCSAYALEAVRRHGAWHGTRLAGRRLCRCHPWGGAGPDPVPELIPH
ncbi:MAG: membrane protein insertion efficiency factor YidD [Verrucomicrobiota bacterium]